MCVLGRINFLGDPSFSPHMTTAELCAAFEVGESTVHAKARVIEKALIFSLRQIYERLRRWRGNLPPTKKCSTFRFSRRSTK
jgi:hypothetical protein